MPRETKKRITSEDLSTVSASFLTSIEGEITTDPMSKKIELLLGFHIAYGLVRVAEAIEEYTKKCHPPQP